MSDEVDLEIAGFYHCSQCMDELRALSRKTGHPMSPETYARLTVGVNQEGTHMIILCRRHDDGLVAALQLASPRPPSCGACGHEHEH